MSRFTSAYSSFLLRLDEVEILRKFAAQKERNDPVALRNQINALSRGAVVLLSSHLEAFVRDLGELALDSLHNSRISRSSFSPVFFYHISKDLIDEIKNTTEPEGIGEKMFNFVNSDLAYWDRAGTFDTEIPVDRFNKGFANPAYKKIKAYFNRFGYSDFQRDLSAKLQANYLPTINMIDHLVSVRNQIAHGDPSATKTPQEVKDMGLIVKRFCQETDIVFANWWKIKYCSIR